MKRPSLFAALAAVVACHSGQSAATPATAPAPAGGPATMSRAATPAMPAGVTAQLIAAGDSLFNKGTCVRCHGAGGVGAQNAPSLLAGPWQHGSGSYEDIVKTITTGVPRDQIKDPSHRFQMNPRGGGQAPLNDDQVKTVAAYVWSISRKK